MEASVTKRDNRVEGISKSQHHAVLIRMSLHGLLRLTRDLSHGWNKQLQARQKTNDLLGSINKKTACTGPTTDLCTRYQRGAPHEISGPSPMQLTNNLVQFIKLVYNVKHEIGHYVNPTTVRLKCSNHTVIIVGPRGF